jgi:hypothetical protein
VRRHLLGGFQAEPAPAIFCSRVKRRRPRSNFWRVSSNPRTRRARLEPEIPTTVFPPCFGGLPFAKLGSTSACHPAGRHPAPSHGRRKVRADPPAPKSLHGQTQPRGGWRRVPPPRTARRLARKTSGIIRPGTKGVKFRAQRRFHPRNMNGIGLSHSGRQSPDRDLSSPG